MAREEATSTLYDVAIIGGGINGCGIARDLAGRGARVILLEAGDLARGTSSNSSKLIHGGLRYLEHFEFRLVREALSERERLWAIAPHVIWPLRFILPHVKGLRPGWLLRLGLFLYDHIGGRKRLPATETVDLATHPAGRPLRDEFRRGFAYSDCWADDSRLVVLNARDAADRGARIMTRSEVTELVREGGSWRIGTAKGSFRAKAIVNTAGPGAVKLLQESGLDGGKSLRLVRGSHIVVPALFDHPHPYFFQLPDGRIFFAIPYEEDFTLIGTTDADHTGALGKIEPSEEEIAYLCEGASTFFRKAVTPDDIVWSYAGVRPLIEDGSGKPEAATRGYSLELSPEADGPPLLNVFGGKLTVYRHLAQEAVDRLATRLPLEESSGWTETASLPGGDFEAGTIDALIERIAARYPFLDARTHRRLARAYGTSTFKIFGPANALADFGADFGSGLTEREVNYLMKFEWAQTPEDILWRRSKLGLRINPEGVARLEKYCIERVAA